MTDKAFKRTNGRGYPEWNWQKIKEAILIGVGVSLITAIAVGSVTWATTGWGEIKNDVKLLIAGQKVQEWNAAVTAERVNANTVLLYRSIDKNWPCPDPIDLKHFWIGEKKVTP